VALSAASTRRSRTDRRGSLADVLVAPAFDDAALARFAASERTCGRSQRLPVSPGAQRSPDQRRVSCPGMRSLRISARDVASGDEARTDRPAVARSRACLEVCGLTSSNAIVLAHGGQVVGIGCGQQNRVDAAGIAGRKAGGRAQGGAGASDAYFPFRDGLDEVIDAGVTAVVQPAGRCAIRK